MRPLQFLAAAAILGWQGITVAQLATNETTQAVCIGNPWTTNQKNQSPCLVAAIIQGACTAGVWDIPAIEPNSVYSGPRSGQSNKCQCNTVAFSVVAACGFCQGGQFATWDAWMKNCTGTDLALNTYPLPIPGNTSIPTWAYLPVAANNVWNSQAANSQAALNNPDVKGSESGPNIPLPSVTGSATGNPSPTSPSASSPSSSSSHAGAIAGGVVGGVVGLALLALGGFLLWRRRRSRETAPSAQFVKGAGSEKVDLVGSPTPVQGPYGNGDGFQSPLSPHLPMQTEPPKLYDPSDPSTYPSAPAPYAGPGTPITPSDHGVAPGWTSPTPSVPYSQASGPYSQPYGHQHQGSGTFGPPQPMGGYRGAPEV